MKPTAKNPVERRPVADQPGIANDDTWASITGQRYALGHGRPTRPPRHHAPGILGGVAIGVAAFIGLGTAGAWSPWLAGLILLAGIVVALAGEQWVRHLRRSLRLTPDQPARPPITRVPRTWHARGPER